jgi:muramoyltetrapeptide carboxypeptidase
MCKVLFRVVLLFICSFFLSSCGHKMSNSVIKDEKFMNSLVNIRAVAISPASNMSEEMILDLREVLPKNIVLVESKSSEEVDKEQENGEDIVEAKYQELVDALYNKNVDVVWSTKGGFGSSKLLMKLSKQKAPVKEVSILGYSDITALHIFLSERWGWHPIHGACLSNFLDPQQDPRNFTYLVNLLNSTTSKAEIKDLRLIHGDGELRDSSAHVRFRQIHGKVTGGNMSILASTIGTPWQVNTDGKILFLEDVREKGYVIERHLQHFSDSGLFDKVVAIVFGEFAKMRDGYVEKVIERFADKTSIPVFQSSSFGHGVVNLPLIYNSSGIISWNEKSEHYELTMSVTK